MKTILKQIIKEEVFKFLSLLAEGKFEDVALKFPEYKEEILWFKNNGLKPKYIEWLVKKFKDLGFSKGLTEEDLVGDLELINNFDKLIEKNQIENKDINSYNYQNLLSTVEDALKNFEKIENKKKNEKDYETVYSDSEWLITQPNTEEASCRLGANTKWCISATQSQNHFNSYDSGGAKFIFIFDRKNKKKWAVAYEPGKSPTVEVYDEQDVVIKNLGKLLPQNIAQIVNNKIGFEALLSVIQIKNTEGVVLYASEEAHSEKEAVEEAVRNKISLRQVNLENANLSGGNFEEADFSRGSLVGANLSRANLYGANLYGADLSMIDLESANLSNASLGKVSLEDAILTDANFEYANLYSAAIPFNLKPNIDNNKRTIYGYEEIVWTR